MSIHPRVENGRTVHPKSNTMKRKDINVIKRTISAIRGHLDNHPNDAMSQTRLANLSKLV